MSKRNNDIPILLREKLGEDFEPKNVVGYDYCIGYCISDWDFPVENYYYEEEECNIGESLKTSGINQACERNDFSEQKCYENVPDEPFVSKNRGHYSSFFKEGSCQWPSLYWAYIDVRHMDGQEEKTIRFKESDRDSVGDGNFEKLRQWLYMQVNDNIFINKSLGHLEVDYDKKEIKAGGRIVDFGRISHYEFEHVETVWGDYDSQDSDAREHLLSNHETMRVCGICEELPDNRPLSVTQGFDEVELKLWFNYYQNEELKTSSLDFSQEDAIEARLKLKPLIKHLRERRASDDFNMFVGEQHLRIGNLASLNIPKNEFLLQRTELPIFGPCTIHAYGTDVITHVSLITEQRLSEEEMLPMLDYMKNSMPMEPYYDDHGYGVIPKPHEINLFWELPQGRVEMGWDGFNYTRGDEPNQPRGDGMDYVRLELWDCESLRQSRDEAYYRSLVD